MRVVLNVSVVLVCGALAGLSALSQSAPTQAAILPAGLSRTATLVPMVSDARPDVTLVGHASSVEAHFEAANTTHDGRLTKDQVDKSDWLRVAKHFDEIDADHRGWISVEQIHDFNKSHRKHRKSTPA